MVSITNGSFVAADSSSIASSSPWTDPETTLPSLDLLSSGLTTSSDVSAKPSTYTQPTTTLLGSGAWSLPFVSGIIISTMSLLLPSLCIANGGFTRNYWQKWTDIRTIG
ncbi:hypothetical protein AMS68_003783 [Peltaster fructicola]|uniref:Uncharacterized protein n=1 Tax=Peltaster fructicola TaxID=286661 RepID=A0A6H0XUB2_9PEZI|nr:hypothetical protein AMS68_003783 [Peltaster fructicola]